MSGSENEASPNGKIQSDDELSLLDLVKLIRRHCAILLGGTIIGGALGLVVAFALPAQWEASVLIRIGQRGDAGTPVESPTQSMSRITESEIFKNDVLRRLGVSPNESDSEGGLLLNSRKVKVEKSDLLSLRVRGVSREAAEQLTRAIVEELKDAHARIAEPTIAHWRQDLVEVNLVLERENKELQRLNRLLNESILASDKNIYQAILANNVLLSREAEFRRFRERKYSLLEWLSPERTFPTSSWGRIEASEQPAFPKKHFFAAGGLVIGLFMAVMLSLLRSYVFFDKKR